jgi:hypothetical protein
MPWSNEMLESEAWLTLISLSQTKMNSLCLLARIRRVFISNESSDFSHRPASVLSTVSIKVNSVRYLLRIKAFVDEMHNSCGAVDKS